MWRGDSQQLEALAFHQLFLGRRPVLVPSTISILDSPLSITVSCWCKVSATGPVLKPLQEYHCQTAQQNARKTSPVVEKKEKEPAM